MSRSGYIDDGDDSDYPLALWRGVVASSIRGKRGQRLLRDLLVALDAMPEKRLIANELVNDGEVCALGALGVRRGIDMTKLDPEEPDEVAAAFDIAPCLAQEIVYENDDGFWSPNFREAETPEHRWARMRKWVNKRLNEWVWPKSPTVAP